MMKSKPVLNFSESYALHCQHLKEQGLRPKTIDAYIHERAIVFIKIAAKSRSK